MQSRRGRRDSPALTGIDGLIPLTIFAAGLCFPLNVRGQGRFTDPINETLERAVRFELDHPNPIVQRVNYFSAQPFIEDKVAAGFQPTSRPRQSFPGVRRHLTQEQQLDLTARWAPQPTQAGGKYAGVIDDDDVALAEVIRKRSKVRVLPALRSSIDDQHARSVPLRQR